MKSLFILLLFFSLLPIRAENSKPKNLKIDTSSIEIRQPSEKTISNFKSDKNFIYDEPSSSNWWDAFWLWVNDQLLKFLGSKTFGFFRKYLSYIIVLAALIIVVIVLKKSKLNGLLYKNRKEKVPIFEEIKENINEIDFEDAISKAVAGKDFRVAVRLYYLKTLKLLSNKELLELKINKTNRNYIDDLKSSNLLKPFEELTDLFECIWYGNFTIEDIQFEKTKTAFNHFHSLLAIDE